MQSRKEAAREKLEKMVISKKVDMTADSPMKSPLKRSNTLSKMYEHREPGSPLKHHQKQYQGYKDKFSMKVPDYGKAFTLRFSPNGGLLAMADDTGNLEIINTVYGYSDHTFKKEDHDLTLTTAVTWKKSNSLLKLNQRLLGVCVDGTAIMWEPTQEKGLQRITLNKENAYQVADYSCFGHYFCAAGKLPQLEIYDDNTMQAVTKFELEKIGH